jgi:L-2,4-diaminobutyric acid acetyltransferase
LARIERSERLGIYFSPRYTGNAVQRPETKRVGGREVRVRSLRPDDTPEVLGVVRAVELDLNSAYAYAMFAEYFGDTSLVAECDDGSVAGFVIGFVPPARSNTVFVWQIGVAPEMRGRGIGSRLLDQLIQRAGCTVLEATVTPSNLGSDRLFRAAARRHEARVETEELFEAALFPAGHEAEIRYVIAPLSTEVHPHGDIRTTRI